MIHFVDFKTDEILGYLVNKPGDGKVYWDAVHKRNLKLEETFEFTMSANAEPAKYATSRMSVVIEGEDGDFREFIVDINDTHRREKEVVGVASYGELKKQKILDPIVLDGQSVDTALDFILDGTEWQRGITEYAGIRKLTFSDPIDAYSALLAVKSLFDVELDFRIETRGNRIVRRVVDVKKRLGMRTSKEVVYSKDLVGVIRQESGGKIISALYAMSPENELGSRLKVIVKDEEARQRWSRNGKHVWDIYEPFTDDLSMTVDRLETLAKTELKKRINAAIEYHVEASSIESIFGKEHEKVRLGDYIRVKDEEFSPPLYLDARVIEIERDITDKAKKTYVLGEFIEYAESDVKRALYQIKNLEKITYPKGVVDGKLTETSDNIKTDIETGQVPLPGESITGLIKAEHIDIDLNIQSGLPQYSSEWVENGYGGWSTPFYPARPIEDWYNWSVFDYFYFNKRKRYLYIRGATGLWRLEPDGYATGYVDIQVTDSNLNELASRSISAWIDKPGNFSIQIDLHSLPGDIPGPYEFYYVRFKPRKTGGTGDLQPYLRLTSRYLHN